MENTKTPMITYYGEIYQEHAVEVTKYLCKAFEYKFSRFKCSPLILSLFAVFNSIEDLQIFEAAIKPFEVKVNDT